MVRTNAMRLLDAENIKYRTVEYEYDENDLSGVKVARSLNMPEEMLFKTLVTKGDKNGYNVFCIPVAEELDLKKAGSLYKKQENRNASCKRPSFGNGVYKRRLFTYRNEEKISCFYRRNGTTF